MSRTSTYIGMFIGSTIGGMIPMLWGAGAFSFASIIFSTLGALIGVYIAHRPIGVSKISRYHKAMEKLDKNPLAWFVVSIALGWLAIETGNFESFILFILAVILAKQIEILSK